MIKMTRQNCLTKYPNFSQRNYNRRTDEETIFYPEVFKSYVLILNSKSLKGHTKMLANEIANFAKSLGLAHLIFLGDTKNNWLTKLSLGRKNYTPLQEALQYLINNKVGKNFNGALKVETAELSIFIQHFFCMVRCDASLPYFFFMDEGQNFVGSICQYGSLHLDILNKKTNICFKKIAPATQFIHLADKRCYPPYSKTSAIKSRIMSV